MAKRKRQKRNSAADVTGTFRQAPKRPVNPFSHFADRLCKVKLHPAPKALRKELPVVKIALVSMPPSDFEPVPFSTLRVKKTPPYLDAEACARSLVGFRNETVAARLASFQEALTMALTEMEAKVVCVSELGFPTGRRLRPSLAAIELSRALSDRHQALLVAGSAHDASTLYNTGFLFYPGSEVLTFHKALSAITVTERIAVPCERNVFAVEIFGLRIATMICLDIADYASVASVVRVSDRIDMILAPCYTPRFEKMARVARAASEALPGIVALANARLDHSDADRCKIFQFGDPVAPSAVHVLPSGATISTLEVNVEKFKEEQIKRKTAPETPMDWLFGRPDNAVVYLPPKATSRPSPP